jgi:hypothetical protein
MPQFFFKYDPVTGKRSVGPLNGPDECPSPSASPFVAARRLLDAYRRKRNMQQNIGRAQLTTTYSFVTLPRNQFIIPAFESFDTISPMLRMWSEETNEFSGKGWSFVCQEAGYYNIKGAVEVLLSAPAVPNTRITYAQAELLVQRTNGNYLPLWQASDIAPVRVIVGPPAQAEQLYMPGFCLTFADKIRLSCGDRLWLHFKYQGLADITYVESYQARLAIQKTGDPTYEDEC